MSDGTVRFHANGTDVYHFGGVATYSTYTVIPESCAIPSGRDALDKGGADRLLRYDRASARC